MSVDPLNLDQTSFAEVVREIAQNPMAEDLPDEPPHPLLENPHVAALCDYLAGVEQELWQARSTDGDMNDDPYFQFNEGMELRLPVVVMLVIGYLIHHPEVLRSLKKKGKRKKT